MGMGPVEYLPMIVTGKPQGFEPELPAEGPGGLGGAVG